MFVLSIHCVARGLVQTFCIGAPHRVVIPCDNTTFLLNLCVLLLAFELFCSLYQVIRLQPQECQ